MNCTARDRTTGKTCSLPAHAGEAHSASGRSFFGRLLAGEAPTRPIDDWAGRHTADEWYEAGDRQVRDRQRRSRERRRMVVNREGAP